MDRKNSQLATDMRMRYDYSGPGSLEDIRLQLRGPIAESPFAGRDKQAKIDYCNRQIALLTKWFGQTENPFFLSQGARWRNKLAQVQAGAL